MPCQWVKLPGGGVAVVKYGALRRKRCRYCATDAAFLCDWPLETGKTCDRLLCGTHAHEVGTGRHCCPEHYDEHDQALRDKQELKCGELDLPLEAPQTEWP